MYRLNKPYWAHSRQYITKICGYLRQDLTHIVRMYYLTYYPKFLCLGSNKYNLAIIVIWPTRLKCLSSTIVIISTWSSSLSDTLQVAHNYPESLLGKYLGMRLYISHTNSQRPITVRGYTHSWWGITCEAQTSFCKPRR